MIAQQSLECEAPASLWIQNKSSDSVQKYKNGTENQSGAGSPQFKVRPERLTGEIKDKRQPGTGNRIMNLS